MIDKAVIVRRLTALDEYYSDLIEARDISFEKFSSNKVSRRYIERTLHMAIEACLDVANHIISYEGFRESINNQDTFAVLQENGILDDELADQLKEMAKFRNVLVHDYLRVRADIVYGILQDRLEDLRQFGSVIQSIFL